MGILDMLLPSNDSVRPEHTKECDHDHPSEDSHYWYKQLERQSGDPYWIEHDATYVKLKAIHQLWVCKYCGKVKEIHTAEEVGGPDGIIREQDIRRGLMDRPEAKTGAFKDTIPLPVEEAKPLDAVIKAFEEHIDR